MDESNPAGVNRARDPAGDVAAPGRYAWPFAIAIVVACAIAAHVYRVADLPMGLYPDESSIGWNAWSIATTGHDEHGVAWPLYFRAFGEYKNPVYIYFLALVYKVLGLSVWTTRLASALCWLIGSAIFARLAWRLFDERSVRLYVLVCLAFTPWLFALSRISFEVIAVYPLLALHLYAIRRTFETPSIAWSIVAGSAIGLAAYAYSTMRLLAPLYVIAMLLAGFDRRRLRELLAFAGAAALTALPLAVYLLAHASNLAARFDLLTYLHDPSLTAADKAHDFFARYIEYFAPSFLAWHGDPNLRHHTGYGGELLLATVILSIAGIAYVMTSRDARRDAFTRFLIAGCALSPIAAALTLDHAHSLRVFPLVVFALLLSAYGLRWIALRFGALPASALVAAAAVQAVFYLHDYFVAYPALSARTFENYGFQHALARAASIAEHRVVVDGYDNQPYVSALFFGAMMPEPHAPIVVGSVKELEPGDVLVFFDPRFEHRELRAGLPAQSLYAIADYAAATRELGPPY
jgi:4-amino-4-deoxy-L-arabinose transferase-like glycosyltransferase